MSEKFDMLEYCRSEMVLIICYQAAVSIEMNWYYLDTFYDPRDFSYWGA